jgi:flagellar L-ring protein precursor FlgH
MTRKYLLCLPLCLAILALPVRSAGASNPLKKKPPEPSALDKYIQEALKNAPQTQDEASVGSLWSPGSRLTDLGSDLRAGHVNDLVTVVVAEQASAVATGATQTSRKSSVAAAITSLFGAKAATSALANLANTANDTELNGSGTTSRGTTLSTTLSARVTHVLPNGYLVLEGTKDILVNSERQHIIVRGIIRPADLTGNVVSSTQIAQLEVNIDGKGVVNDAVKRPNILYRLLLGILPF